MKFKSRFDTIVWSAIVVFAILLGGMIVGGDFTQPEVQYFNGANDYVSPQIGQFLFRFNRLMNKESVEKGFKISPAIDGQFSWSGRTFAFTAKAPLQYGQHYTVIFQDAFDLEKKLMTNNIFQASTQPQQILFLDTNGMVQRMNLSDRSIEKVSPAHLFVQEFRVSPLGDMIALLATDRRNTNLQDQSIFKVYVLSQSDQVVHTVPSSEGAILDNLQWLPDALGIGFTSITADSHAEGIRVYDLSTKTLSSIADGKARAYQFYFTPDASRIAYIDTNGALILGDMPSGNGSLIATTFTDIAGFDSFGERLVYIAPLSVNPFDLANVPILMDGEGNESKISVPTNSTSFDVQFIPNKKIVLFTLEQALGDLRKDEIYQYNYEQQTLKPVIEKDECSASHPVASIDGNLLVWQCVKNEHKGYTITGWNDYQGKFVTADLWLKDLVSGEEKNLGVQGAEVQFQP